MGSFRFKIVNSECKLQLAMAVTQAEACTPILIPGLKHLQKSNPGKEKHHDTYPVQKIC